MARRLELKTVKIATGNGEDATFSYGMLMVNALRYADPQRGTMAAEILRSAEVQRPVVKAIEEGSEAVTLTEEQYKTLVEKVDTFPFAVADLTVADFLLHIHDAPEIGTEPEIRRAA